MSALEHVLFRQVSLYVKFKVAKDFQNYTEIILYFETFTEIRTEIPPKLVKMSPKIFSPKLIAPKFFVLNVNK